MSNIESIKTRIAALLAKAESTDNAHEQDAFMNKVNELLERHQIEMHEIRNSMGRESDPITKLMGDLPSQHEWPTHVGFKLARFYGAKMIRHDHTQKVWNSLGTKQHRKVRYTYSVVGRESACQTFELMFPFVLSQVRQQARKFSQDTGLSISKAERSVGVALVDRINAMIPATEARRIHNEENALVPVTDIEAAVKELFGSLKTIKNPTTAIYEGADEYAGKVSLNVQTTAETKKQIGSK